MSFVTDWWIVKEQPLTIDIRNFVINKCIDCQIIWKFYLSGEFLRLKYSTVKACKIHLDYNNEINIQTSLERQVVRSYELSEILLYKIISRIIYQNILLKKPVQCRALKVID